MLKIQRLVQEPKLVKMLMLILQSLLQIERRCLPVVVEVLRDNDLEVDLALHKALRDVLDPDVRVRDNPRRLLGLLPVLQRSSCHGLVGEKFIDIVRALMVGEIVELWIVAHSVENRKQRIRGIWCRLGVLRIVQVNVPLVVEACRKAQRFDCDFTGRQLVGVSEMDDRMSEARYEIVDQGLFA